MTGRRTSDNRGETYPWLSGGITPEHEGRTDPTRVTRADAHHYARLPPGGVQGWRACPHAQPGCSTRGAPPAAARQLHLLTVSTGAPQAAQIKSPGGDVWRPLRQA